MGGVDGGGPRGSVGIDGKQDLKVVEGFPECVCPAATCPRSSLIRCVCDIDIDISPV